MAVTKSVATLDTHKTVLTNQLVRRHPLNCPLHKGHNVNIHKMNNNTSLSTWLFGVVSMVFDSLTLNEWAVVIGMSATIFSFLINWYYKHQEVKIKNNH